MICFVLTCTDEHRFEGWFKSSETFERQCEAGTLECPICGDRDVRKPLMAPAIARGGRSTKEPPGDGESKPPAPAGGDGDEAAPVASGAGLPVDPRLARFLQLARRVQAHVEKNFDDVGDRFATEARAIHCGEAERRGICGRATAEEARSLDEEGIEVMPLPRLPKLSG